MKEKESQPLRIRRKRQSKPSHLPRAKVNWIHLLIAILIAISMPYFVIHRGPEEMAPQTYNTY